MSGGDIVAGGHVKVRESSTAARSRPASGSASTANSAARLESNDVEIGAAARGKGEIFYRETLCIQKGARVEGKVTSTEAERKPEAALKIESNLSRNLK